MAVQPYPADPIVQRIDEALVAARDEQERLLVARDILRPKRRGRPPGSKNRRTRLNLPELDHGLRTRA